MDTHPEKDREVEMVGRGGEREKGWGEATQEEVTED